MYVCINTMQGREAKHVQIASFARNSQYKQRWYHFLRHDHISKYTLNMQISRVFMLILTQLVVLVQTILSFINMNFNMQVYCKLKYNGLLRPLSLKSLKGND